MMEIETLCAADMLPVRAHEHDAGADLRASEYTTIGSKQFAVVSTGVRVSIPEGYFGLLAGQRQRQSFQLPFSLSALADYISADRSAMMRELKKMKDERLVEVAGRQVTLCGPTQ